VHEGELPDEEIPLARVKGEYFKEILNFAKEPISMHFGFGKGSDQLYPTAIYMDSVELSAVIAQMYETEKLGEVTNYITHKKGKVVEATKKEATERALKQNKEGNKMLEFDLDMSGKEEVESVEVPPTPSIVVDKDEMDSMEEMQRSIRSTEEVISSLEAETPIAPKHLFENREIEAISGADEVLKSLEADADDPLTADLLLVTRQLADMRQLTEVLLRNYEELKGNLMVLIHKRLRKPVENVPLDLHLPPPLPDSIDPGKHFIYDVDAVADFFVQRAGKETSTLMLKEHFSHMKEASMHSAINRLEKHGVISRIKRGCYYSPPDVATRFESIKDSFAVKRKRKHTLG
jgi:uncharacterized membrane protein